MLINEDIKLKELIELAKEKDIQIVKALGDGTYLDIQIFLKHNTSRKTIHAIIEDD